MSYKDYFKPAFAIAALVATAPSTTADAAPRVGAAAADGRATDVDGRVFSTAAVKGRPIVIVYEDKDSANMNAGVKRDLAQMMKSDATRAALVVAAVADVSEYDSWPAKGFVKDAIRDESKKSGTTIWCDWNASFRKALALGKGTSNVVVIGRDGHIKFAVEGALTKEQRGDLATIIDREVAATK